MTEAVDSWQSPVGSKCKLPTANCKRLILHPSAFILGCVLAACAHAADPVRDYPLRPVRLVSPFAAGGTATINARVVADQIKALTLAYQPRVLALDMSRVSDIEYSALQMLIESDQRAAGQGVVLWLAALNPRVLEVVRRAGFDKQLGNERLMFNARMVIERYQALRATQARVAAGAADR